MIMDSLEFGELNSVQPEPETVKPFQPGRRRSRTSATSRLLKCRHNSHSQCLAVTCLSPH